MTVEVLASDAILTLWGISDEFHVYIHVAQWPSLGRNGDGSCSHWKQGHSKGELGSLGSEPPPPPQGQRKVH